MDPEVIRAEAAAEGWWSRGRTEIVMGLLPDPNGRLRVLDVGCGWGAIASHLGAWGEVIGVEPSPVARDEAEARGVRVLDGRAEALPVDDASVEIAIAGDVIEHVDDDAAAVAEIARALRPGGTALVTVPAYPWLFGAHDRALDHRRRYTRGGLVTLLRRAGLEPTRITYFNTLLFPLVLPVRLLRRNSAARAEGTGASGPLDAILYRVFRSERALLRRVDLPFGLSLAALAAKPRA